MMFVDNDRRVNQKLKHFQVALGSSNKSYLEWAIQKLGSLNNQIAATDCVKIRHPELIGSTELHLAVLRNNLKAFRMLLCHGADYTLKNQKGLTTLHLALNSVIYKNVYPPPQWTGRLDDSFITAVLSAHIEYRQNANPCDPNGLSHFHIACITNNVKAVNFFLESGVSINNQVNENSKDFSGYTALHFAVRYFSFQVVKTLLKYGASTNVKDAEGMTPMHVLLKRNFEMVNINSDLRSAFQQERALSEKITMLLLNDIGNKDTVMIDDSGLSRLHAASALMDLLAVEELLKKVTDINHCVNVESPQLAGYTALHFAAIFNVNIVKLLVKRGADLQAKDAKGVTPLNLCLERYKVEDVHSILSQKEEWKDIKFSDGKTKLLDFIAAMISYEHFKKFLKKVTKKKVITLPNNSSLWSGFTPMHLVVLFARSIANEIYLEMLSALFEKNGEMIETQDIHGHTPLHLCFRLGKLKDVADLLMTLHQKLDNPLDLVDEDNLSLLHIACANENEQLIKKLLRHSNKVNLAYTGECIEKLVVTGWTPLDVIANQRQKFGKSKLKSSTEKRLIEHGAYANATDADYEAVEERPVDAYTSRLFSKRQALKAPRHGWTALHEACIKRNTDLVEHLMNTGANVNAKISSDSRIKPGYTPLHLSLVRDYGRKDTNHLLRLLLDRNADVTVPNAKQRTPIHMAYQHYISQLYYFGLCEPTFKDLSMLLRAHKDFTVNPASIEGITHLHIASSLADFVTVEKFLKYGNVDVDQPIDFFFENHHSFKHFPGAGCTSLHLAVMRKDDYSKKKYVDITSQLETVDLLLKHGANVDAENALGETPFHMAICFELRERLVRGGANVEAKNAYGHTLLQSLLSKRPESSDTIIELLRCGCRYNTFDSDTGIGCIGLTMRSLPLKEMQKLLSMATINFPDATNADEFGRTMIHNLVSIYQINVSAADYATIIEQMTRTGCNVDDRDQMGRTALHIAVEFKNMRAVSGLFLAGADINIIDENGKTPSAFQFEPCTQCDEPTDAEDEQCVHYRIFKLLALRVKKLQICGLDVHPMTEEIVARAFPNFGRVNLSDQFTNELEELKNVRIGSYRLTLHDFMSETNAVADYPTMSEAKQNAVNKFFLPNDEYRQFREKYSEVAGLLSLQYRKAVDRMKLIPKAKRSLDFLTDIRVPEVCSRIILRFLKNSELQNAIVSNYSK